MEQKTRLSGRVAARITSRGPALEMQEHGKSLHRSPPASTEDAERSGILFERVRRETSRAHSTHSLL
jgi:hypothetical protein